MIQILSCEPSIADSFCEYCLINIYLLPIFQLSSEGLERHECDKDKVISNNSIKHVFLVNCDAVTLYSNIVFILIWCTTIQISRDTKI